MINAVDSCAVDFADCGAVCDFCGCKVFCLDCGIEFLIAFLTLVFFALFLAFSIALTSTRFTCDLMLGTTIISFQLMCL